MHGPLVGFTVGITGHRRWEEQAEILTRRGARVVHGPTISTRLLGDTSVTLAATEAIIAAPVDVMVFTTGLGVRSWFSALESWGLDDRVRDLLRGAAVVTRGPKATHAAAAAGVAVDWVAASETNAEVVAELTARRLAGKRVVVQRDGGEPLVARAMAAMGADVVDLPVYVWETPDDPALARRLLELAVARRIDAVTFTCSYAVRSAFELSPDAEALRQALSGRVRAVAVGPVTAQTLREHGVARVVEPKRARLGSMIHALSAELEAMRRRLHHGETSIGWHGNALVGAEGVRAELTPGELHLLERLIDVAPAVISKAELTSPDTDEHAVEAAMTRLRSKLGPLGTGITTVRRRGYGCSLLVGPVA